MSLDKIFADNNNFGKIQCVKQKKKIRFELQF